MMKHKASHEYKTSRDASIFHHGKFCISVYKSTNHIPKLLKGSVLPKVNLQQALNACCRFTLGRTFESSALQN